MISARFQVISLEVYEISVSGGPLVHTQLSGNNDLFFTLQVVETQNVFGYVHSSSDKEELLVLYYYGFGWVKFNISNVLLEAYIASYSE